MFLAFPLRCFIAFSLIIATHAATVTNTDDSGPGSLRQVISEATPGEIIAIPLTLSGQTITLSSGPLEITQELTISASNNILDAQELNTIITISPTGNLSLDNITLTKGTATRGGALYNFGTATLTSCTLVENSSTNHGGALYNEGELTIEDSIIRDNSTPTRGGAIRNTGTLTLRNTFVTGNSAGSSGGAIRNDGTLTVENSTLSDNTTNSSGGAIYSEGTLLITNSTIAQNFAGSEGGGIFSDGQITVKSCTVSANESEEEGGGISIRSADVLSLENSIVAGNFTDNGAFNIAGDLTDASVNNFTSGIPLLAPLANYGGTTPTMPPFEDSPVIDSPGTTTLTIDQRGGQRIIGTGLDLGAAEAGAFPGKIPGLITNPIVTTLDDELDTTAPLDLADLSLREALTYATSGSTIRFATGAPIVLEGGQLSLTRALTIGTSTNNAGIDADNKSRIFFIPGSIKVTLNSLSLTNGETSNSVESVGACIFNLGDLTLNSCALISNTTSSEGGAIFSDGKLTLDSCELKNNSADFAGGALSNFDECSIVRCLFEFNTTVRFGGAIRNSGTLTVSETTFSGNTVTQTDIDQSEGGGAIRNSSNGTLTLERCLLNANTSTHSGGALYNSSNGSITAINTTFTGNNANNGGAIFNSGSGGLIKLTHATIASNNATNTGGGILSAAATSNTQSLNSIIAGNTAGTDENFSGGLTPESSNNLTTGDPMLAPPSSDGVMVPLTDSPVLNAGATTTLLTDQRELPRSMGGAPDLGSVEIQPDVSATFDADSDGDGMNDGLEFALGRDPFFADSASSRSLTISPTGIRFGFNPASAENTILQLLRSPDLQSYNPTIYQNNDNPFDAPLNGLLTIIDEEVTDTPKQFYVLRAFPRE